MAERPDRNQRDKTQVVPTPAREDFFVWLEKLFAGAEDKPERIELRQVYGPGLRKYGLQVLVKEFKQNAPKPPRESIVAMSNEFLDAAQQNCNGVGKRHRYAVYPKHYNKGDAPYAVFILDMKPKQIPGDQYDPNEVEDEGDDEDSRAQDMKRRDTLLAYGLEHIKQADTNDQWRQEAFSQATGDIIERYQNLVAMLMTQNMEMQKEHRELFKTAEDALSKKHERELAADMQKFKMAAMGDALQFIKQMAPVAVNQITGKQTIPTKMSNESMAIESFLKGITEPQGKALFGDIKDDGTVVGNGIFTREQVLIFSGVANLSQPAEALDQLIVGPNAVNDQQLMQAAGVLAQQQYLPLGALLMQRKQKLVEAGQAQA